MSDVNSVFNIVGRSIDTSDAMEVPGVVTFLSAKDVPGSNLTGPIIYDETVFADDKVFCKIPFIFWLEKISDVAHLNRFYAFFSMEKLFGR